MSLVKYCVPTVFAAVLVLAGTRGARGDVFTYMALGDSGAFGVGANDSSTDVSNGDRGYAGPVRDHSSVGPWGASARN